MDDAQAGGRRLERKKLAPAAGGEDIGCSLYELPEGSRSWPNHYHTGNEEVLFVFDGTGTLRLDGEPLPLEAGDYVALPADERGVHQVVNDSVGDLQYLMVSTMSEPDVMVYPDFEKVGVFVGSPPGGKESGLGHLLYRAITRSALVARDRPRRTLTDLRPWRTSRKSLNSDRKI